MKRYLLDDKDIAKPPYGGPAGEPLPDKELTDEEVAAAIENILGKPKKAVEDRKDRLWTKQDIISRVWERQFRDTARERFEADKRKLLSLMKGRQKEAKAAKATIDWEAIYQDWMEYLDGAGAAWRSAFVPLMKGLILDQGAALNIEFGMVFDVANLFAQKWFDTYTLTFAEDVVTVTGAAMDSMLKTAMAEGWSIPVMQKRLELMFKAWMKGDLAPDDFEWFELRMPSYRTEMIARTETIRASNKGADALYQAWGAEWKEWVAGLDERTCPFCLALNGKRFRAGAIVKMDGVEFTKGAVWNYKDDAGDTYTIKFDYETVTGPPLHVQCRCSWVPWKESWGEKSYPSPHVGLPGVWGGSAPRGAGVSDDAVAEQVVLGVSKLHGFTKLTGREGAYLIDEDGNKVGPLVEGHGTGVDAGQQMYDAESLLVHIHSHPINVSFSGTDIEVFLHDSEQGIDSIEHMVAVTPNGTLYVMSKTDATLTWGYGDTLPIQQTWGNTAKYACQVCLPTPDNGRGVGTYSPVIRCRRSGTGLRGSISLRLSYRGHEMTKPSATLCDDKLLLKPPWAPDLEPDTESVELDEERLMAMVRQLMGPHDEEEAA